MASLIYFRVIPGKWLESACNCLFVALCGLYDDIGQHMPRVYAGRFTLYFSDFNVEKCPSIALRHQLKISAPNQIYRGIGGVRFNPQYKIPYIRVYSI